MLISHYADLASLYAAHTYTFLPPAFPSSVCILVSSLPLSLSQAPSLPYASAFSFICVLNCTFWPPLGPLGIPAPLLTLTAPLLVSLALPFPLLAFLTLSPPPTCTLAPSSRFLDFLAPSPPHYTLCVTTFPFSLPRLVTGPTSETLIYDRMLRLRNFLHIWDYSFTYCLRVTIHLQIPLPSVMCPCVT